MADSVSRLTCIAFSVAMAAAGLCVSGCDKADQPAPPGSAESPPQASPVVAQSEPVVQPPTADTADTSLELKQPSPPGTSSAATLPAQNRQRLADDRPDLNDRRLAAAGIQVYEGRRLLLLSDAPAEQVRALPDLADQLFASLEQHFGELPDAPDGSPFQVTGCVIHDEQRFRTAGLMPPESFTFDHGRHRHYQFWMFNPDDDYYRRHLMLHEFTHCFMTCESGMQDIPSLWYIEGMAEYFATHRPAPDDSSAFIFGVLPEQFAGFEGWGRISELRRAFQVLDGRADEPSEFDLLTLEEVMPAAVAEFSTGTQYSGSWAFCWFLHNHPAYKQQCGGLSKLRRRGEFVTAARALRAAEGARLGVDWLLFQEALCEGYDAQRAWPVHTAGVNIGTAGREITISADRGWQDTGVRLQQDDQMQLTCAGRYTLNNQPRAWISEPQGVSIDYHRSMPLGCVTAVLVGDDGERITRRFNVGREARVTAPWACSLWLQVNDRANSRANNDGACTVTLRML